MLRSVSSFASWFTSLTLEIASFADSGIGLPFISIKPSGGGSGVRLASDVQSVTIFSNAPFTVSARISVVTTSPPRLVTDRGVAFAQSTSRCDQNQAIPTKASSATPSTKGIQKLLNLCQRKKNAMTRHIRPANAITRSNAWLLIGLALTLALSLNPIKPQSKSCNAI